MNVIVKPSQVVVRMSPHHVVTHQRPRVHETGGLGETLWGTQLVSVPRRYPQDYDPRRHGLEKLENHLHQGGPCTPFGLEGSKESGAVLLA
jgi:hypothetical protein